MLEKHVTTPPSLGKDANRRAALLLPALVALLITQSVFALRSFRGDAPGLLSLDSSVAWIALQVFWLGITAYLIWKVWLAARYRPLASVDDAELPSVTVVVPAYNESNLVFDTLFTLVESRYPARKLQLIAVDDGSTDDTWTWMRKARDVLGDRVQIIRCRHNRGKRHALYEGFIRARGDVIVTVDGDSEVLRDTLRNLVSPFVRDGRVGAVAGNVRVNNLEAGAIPRMLDVAFTYAFEFMRATESEVRTVQCCPGALSAFRRTLVQRHADTWLHQRFLGRPANIGEDRAMTNLVLQDGFHVRFQSNAIVRTEVPVRWRPLTKMFTRWARSNVRETLVLGTFVFSRVRPEPMGGARANFVFAATTIVLGATTFLPAIALMIVAPALLGWFVVACVVGSVLPLVVFGLTRTDLRNPWSTGLWSVPYALFAAFTLSWIAPFALVTVRRSGWLTRGLTSAPALHRFDDVDPRPAPDSLAAQSLRPAA